VPFSADKEQPDTPAALTAAVDDVAYSLPEELRYRLARSVLLLDSGQTLPREVHEDAALFGVPAVIGRGADPPLWPPSEAGAAADVAREARALLTNPVLAGRVSYHCREICRELLAPDEHAIAQTLREQHRLERAQFVAAGV
jgi:hypothetical protein